MKLYNKTHWLISLVIIVCSTITLQAQNSQDNTDRQGVVDFQADIMKPVDVGDTTALNLVGNVSFFHNGTIITCDSAIRYSDRRMECFNNVVVNKQDTYVYGDRADYNGELNIAHIYAPIIKMVNKDATMYTYEFAFNTLTNVGIFGGKATMEQRDNLLESQRGYFYADSSVLLCVDDVEIENPDYKLQSDSVGYNMNTEVATFYTQTYIWNSKGEILSAKKGLYDQPHTTYDFTSEAYILTKDQELWSDTLNYNSTSENATLYNNIQIGDRTQNTMLFGNFAEYWGAESNALVTEKPSLINFDPQQPDTLYMRSDSIFIYTVNTNELAAMDTSSVKKIVEEVEYIEYVEDTISSPIVDSITASNASALGDSTAIGDPNRVTDTLNNQVKKAIKGESDAEPERSDSLSNVEIAPSSVQSTLDEQAKSTTKERVGKSNKELKAEKKRLKKEEQKAVTKEKRERKKKKEKVSENIIIANNSVDSAILSKITQSDSTKIYTDSTKVDAMQGGIVSDSTTITSDSTIVRQVILQDSTGVQLDSLNMNLATDSTAVEADSIQRILRAYNNVKIYRKDFQAVCDSLVGFSIDSTLRLYINPVLWNAENQITSSVVDIYTKNQAMDKAVFTGEPIMSSKVREGYFNQIKGKVIEAIMIDNTIKRTDVIGNGQTYYYMQDDATGGIMGFLVAECADITFAMDSSTVETITYRGDPKYKIYPMDQIPTTQDVILPGFKWEVDRRPLSKEEVFDRVVRDSRRTEYESKPKPQFDITKYILENKEMMIKDEVWIERNDTIPRHIRNYFKGAQR